VLVSAQPPEDVASGEVRSDVVEEVVRTALAAISLDTAGGLTD